MALYWLAKDYIPYSKDHATFSDGAKVFFTNDPSRDDPYNASYYTEWVPGATKVNMKASGISEIREINKIQIVNIGTFGRVEMPEDCTGLFSNMGLFMQPDSYLLYYKDSPDAGYQTSDHTRNLKLDFSNFDFSNTKIMTSLFENACGLFHCDLQAQNYMGHYSVWVRWDAYTMQFSGLDSWDTSNVEKVDRMFANLLWHPSGVWADGRRRTDYVEFVSGGTNLLSFPKATTAANMFAGASLDMNDLRIELGPNCSDLSFMFSNYTPHYYISENFSNTLLDLSNWSIQSTGANMKSMFRNIGIRDIKLGSVLNDAVASAQSDAALDYMFANDGSINVGKPKKIIVKPGTNWAELNPSLSGYKMFINDTGLSNFIASNNNINYANNTKSTGYFDQAPPEKISGHYIKKNVGGSEVWLDSDIYIKTGTGQGTWKYVTEVYM